MEDDQNEDDQKADMRKVRFFPQPKFFIQKISTFKLLTI